MSIPAFAWALEQGTALGLTPAERLVLIFLADKANGARVCWPGQETIRAYTGLALRTVRSVVAALARRGLIRVEDRPGIVTRYHILRDDTPANKTGVTPAKGNGVEGVIHSPGKSSPGKPPQPRQNVPDHPGKSCSEPRHITTGTPANGATEPYLTKKENLERGARARARPDIDSGVKEAQPPQQPEPEAEARVSPEALAAVSRSLGRSLLSPFRYPPRPSGLTHREQIAACQAPQADPPPLKLNPAVATAVLAARAALAARTGQRVPA